MKIESKCLYFAKHNDNWQENKIGSYYLKILMIPFDTK